MDAMPQRYSTKETIPLTDTQATATTVISDLDEIIRSTPTQGANIPIDDYSRLFSNLNTMQYNDYGDDTEINRTWTWIPPATGNLEKITFHIGILMNMTARSSDASTWSTATINLTDVSGKEIINRTYSTGLAASDAAGEVRMFVIADAISTQHHQIAAGVPIEINITTAGNTLSANHTWEMGIPHLFPLTIDTGSKWLYEPTITFHISRMREKFDTS